MFKRFPTGKTVGLCLVAAGLGLWSLPNVPGTCGGTAVPTVAAPAEGTQTTAPTPAHPQRTQLQHPAQPRAGQTSPANDARPQPGQNASPAPQPTPRPANPTEPTNKFSPYVPIPRSQLRIRVIDGRSQQPIQGAEVVILETEQRLHTGADGLTPWADAPVLRDPRFRPMVAELHGQLGAIAYKNGYRDSIHLGIRMHEGIRNETTIWMYRLGPGDSRVEPVLYQVPYHRLWLIQLADKFRSKTQPGEGPERP
ncbi:hypothetical protein GCM10025857_07990 [Alicyclobacillus contaminans]|uniref:hypothetical protein n=1 Tax=Alicyclobacillus contaminans TaxID=392016 RepID=UPI0003F63DBE|nr:hypothetical protein [Alicyclobacillus contaminans]GMA49442.1 hypothetical protein GCM10025857_07990 [Alicyclobacillus contaminans]